MADAPTTTSTVKTKTCKFFESKKGCKFGNECQFLHPEKLSNESGSILTEVGKPHEDQKQPDTSANVNEISHWISSTSNSTAKPCRFFKSKRGCAFSKKCRFLHPDLKIPNESETISKVNNDLHDGDQKEAVLSSNNETQGEEKLEKGIEEQKESSDRQGIICKFFQRKRGCLRGNKCPFAHVISADGAINLKPHARKGSKKAGNLSSKQKPHQNKEASKPIKQITKQPIESCNTQTENHNKELDRQETVQVPPPPNKDASAAKDTGMGATEHNPGEHKRLRSIEIQQLKTRFRGSYYEIKENESYKIKFKPTDPDWPFKIDAVYLNVSFPEDYPLHIFAGSLSEDQGLSQDVINFVTLKIQQWALEQEQASKDQGVMKLYFRPFLRWFDKNLESFIVDAGRQMRGSFVSSITTEGIVANNPPPDNLCIPGTGLTPVTCHVQCTGYDNHSNKTGTDTEHVNRTQSNESSDSLQLVEKDEGNMEQSLLCHIEPKKANGQERDNDALGSCASDTDVREMLESNNLKEIVGMDNKSLTVSEQDPDNCEETDQTDQPGLPDDAVSAANTVRRGTEIQFRGLNLEENVSTLIGNRIVFTLECNRCKQRIDQQLSASGSVSNQCTRCVSVFAATYRPAIIHQFSSVLGYLDLNGCAPFDVVLPESELKIGCLHCSKETTVKGLQYGAIWSWCRHCHTKLGFQIQSTRFQVLQINAHPTATLRKSKDSSTSSKPKKPTQSSGIKEGLPLPGNGTCKHYKKSYRWLRFPCCGKCYPCDLCHEEQEGHEMKYATRMICGFCSREQPYSQHPCNGCKSSVTKSRSAHWEGGKGCRDKLSMSRNDDQKYRQQGKTTSRKAQKLSERKGKGKGNKAK